ncbi:hypothetical protein ACEWY4_020861 [Coilia grayii]|uniref:Disease resistance R13L4/SHOC-2-like LRR domain-containing protein n=1 Tax=Coilia grayii TaxID=363190 RepID=A0ABD1JAQ9_9TELE
MAKGARGGPKVTLKMAKARVRESADGWRRLNLSKMGLTALPPAVLKLGHLDELDLSRNQLQSLPAGLDKLQGLVSLDLHSNQLHTLPDALGHITSLQTLNLAHNRLEGLPESLGQLSGLRSLNLGLNQLRSLPPWLSGLGSLTHLALFDNLLECVPACVSELKPQLQHLSLHRNPLTHTHTQTHTHTHTQMEGCTVPPGGQEGVQEEEAIYLVRRAWLCAPCLRNIKGEEREEPEFREGRFLRMTTPNSVAILNQHIWRHVRNAPRIALCR